MMDGVKMNRLVAIVVTFTCIVHLPAVANNIDPCDAVELLYKVNERSVDFDAHGRRKRHPGHGSICDVWHIPFDGAWYRIEGLDMVSAPTGPFKCNTDMPIWMDGSIPSVDDGIVERKACQTDFVNDCADKLNIRVKNCGTYRAYFLRPPTACKAAYCFEYEEGKEMPPTQTTTKPSIIHNLVKTTQGRLTRQQLEFICIIDSLNDVKYFYQVMWFIDGRSVYMSRPDKDPKNPIHKLTEENGIKQLGINVTCAVRLKFDPDGIPGQLSDNSDPYYAGIEIQQRYITLKREGTANIFLKPTVPIGCIFANPADLEPRPCEIIVELTIPETHGQCMGSIGMPITNADKAKLKNCGQTIQNTQWDQGVNLEIMFNDIETYDLGQKVFKISLKTQANNRYHAIWSNVKLPATTIVIEEEDRKSTVWKGKTCYAVADPHMKTFDGLRYESHVTGTYTLYENDDEDRKTQVQMTTMPCNKNGRAPHCVCGVAVRAGGDVYAVSRCPGNRIFGVRACFDNILDARKINDRNYKIYLPSGTYVQIVVNTNYNHVLNVYMYPSLRDVGHTYGLCGTLNGNVNDDLTGPEGQLFPQGNGNAFTKSWSVTYDKNLLTMDLDRLKQLKLWDTTIEYCSCPTDVVGGTGPSTSFQCSKDSVVKCTRKTEQQITRRRCKIHKQARKRRSIAKIDDASQYKRERRSPKVKVWTDEEAKEYCEKYLTGSAGFEACSENIPGLDSKGSIETCILDIKYTGSTDWAASSKESLVTSCFKELKQNITYHKKPERDSEETTMSPLLGSLSALSDVIKQMTCPDDCGGKGECVNGSCVCEDNYGAADCSLNLLDPPSVIGVNYDDEGVCDPRTCDEIDVEGDNFIDNENLTCRYIVLEVTLDGKVILHETTVKDAKFNTLMEIHCPLPSIRHKRSTDIRDLSQGSAYVIAVSLSYDGKTFSKEYNTTVLNEECQIMTSIDTQPSLKIKEGYCLINAECFLDEHVPKNNNCSICATKMAVTTWSNNPACTEQNAKDGDSTSTGVNGCQSLNTFHVINIAITILSFMFKPEMPVWCHLHACFN